MKKTCTAALIAAAIASTVSAQSVVSHYDDLTEGFYGQSWTHNGVTYRDVNIYPGSFPDGSTFPAGDPGQEIMIENATVFYNDFPGWGSPSNVLTFGSAYVPGNNLSLGALVNVEMDLAQLADSASMEIAYYENGPWIGIEYHLDALLNGVVVASDSLTIAGEDPTGRDRIALATLGVDGAAFDSLSLYATYGDGYSAPRLIMDNFTVNYVPAPGAIGLLAAGGLAAARRRR